MSLKEVTPLLLLCPFCGGTPLVDMSTAQNNEPRFTIRCCSCAAEGGWGKTLIGAARFWNMREGKCL